tara:strand:- start:18108 stop:18491 length:384 start_codon:yes stop_codon:yes gene_type:complete
MSDVDTVTKGDLSNAIDTFFDRVVDYFPPPVFVGRGRAMQVSVLASLVILVISLYPALKMKKQAETPMDDLVAIGAIITCVVATIVLQRLIMGVVYNIDMYSLNRQHFANTHWVSEYNNAKSTSKLL